VVNIVVVAHGRSLFRYEGLLKLTDLVGRLRWRQGPVGVELQIGPEFRCFL